MKTEWGETTCGLLTDRMDAKITTTIRECFADTTMLVIAHRLATIVA